MNTQGYKKRHGLAIINACFQIMNYLKNYFLKIEDFSEFTSLNLKQKLNHEFIQVSK